MFIVDVLYRADGWVSFTLPTLEEAELHRDRLEALHGDRIIKIRIQERRAA